MGEVTVTLRNEDHRPRGQIRFTKIDAVIRKNEIDSFIIEVDPRDNDKLNKVKPGWGVIIQEDELVISGPINSPSMDSTDGILERKLVGISDMTALADRLTLPDPKAEPGNQTVAYYKAKGPAETIIKNMVSANAGVDAIPARKTRRFKVAASQGQGAISTVNTRLKNLLVEAAKIADASNLVMTCAQAPGTLDSVFDIHPARNRSRRIRFSPATGEVTEFSNQQDAPTVTAVIVGAEGEGADRTLVEYSNNDGWGGRRIEVFKDRRDTDEADEMAKTANEELSKGAAGVKVTFTVTDSAYRRFGRDYQVGDVVSVELQDGAVLVEQITSAKITWANGYREVELVIGNSEDDKVTSEEKRKLRDLSMQLLHLQTSK